MKRRYPHPSHPPLVVSPRLPPFRPRPTRRTPLEKKIKALTEKLTPELIDIRRGHPLPPRARQPVTRTSAIVAEYFRKLGLEVRTGYAESGVIGILKGGKPGPVVAMRGDMDALPITEETDLPFASKDKPSSTAARRGSCTPAGTTSTRPCSSASPRSSRPSRPNSRARSSSSPSRRGVLRRGQTDDRGRRLQGHRPGRLLRLPRRRHPQGRQDRLHLGLHIGQRRRLRPRDPVRGLPRGRPWLCVDPIVVGAEIVTALQVMVAREFSVHNNTVITVGSFHAGSAPNIIPRSARLEATVRNYGDDQRQLLQEKITRLVTNICEAAGAAFTSTTPSARRRSTTTPP